MSSNRELILRRYSEEEAEDERYKRSRCSALEFHYTKKHLEEYISKDRRILEVGCATGYYGMYYADKCREYVGVDIVPEHIELFRKKIASAGLKNVSCSVGDAVDLSAIPDDSFDIVLCLGPCYHLPPDEREKAVAECARVCKKGGIVALAYINMLGVYAGACIVAGDIYPNEQANAMVLEQKTDDIRPGLFFYTAPEEMNAEVSRYGLKKLKNLGTDFFIFLNVIDAMTDERFETMRPLCDKIANHESCTGLSNHALLVCEKV